MFLRCPTSFRHRPSQADLLHVDIEWRGMPIAHDAGTFSYNTTGPFGEGFKEASVHNTITFDGGEPVQKFSRFLYLPWPKGEAGWKGDAFAASHDGWSRLGITHRRRVTSPRPGEFVVTDIVASKSRHRARLHWLLGDFAWASSRPSDWSQPGSQSGHQAVRCGLPTGFNPEPQTPNPEPRRAAPRLAFQAKPGERLSALISADEESPYDFPRETCELVLRTQAGPFSITWKVPGGTATLVRADPNSARGWWSPHYHHAAPALSLAIDFEFSGDVEVETCFAPA